MEECGVTFFGIADHLLEGDQLDVHIEVIMHLIKTFTIGSGFEHRSLCERF